MAAFCFFCQLLLFLPTAPASVPADFPSSCSYRPVPADCSWSVPLARKPLEPLG